MHRGLIQPLASRELPGKLHLEVAIARVAGHSLFEDLERLRAFRPVQVVASEIDLDDAPAPTLLELLHRPLVAEGSHRGLACSNCGDETADRAFAVAPQQVQEEAAADAVRESSVR